ncbi:NB-ARC domain-containing protein [Actinoallomurus sp. NPDC052308]|uniref:NB-ARC domain-containing protein n=1 Tax=Actinoallomurus sp. NPDC052308 TaxID=3155530 RepID=UPI003427C37E
MDNANVVGGLAGLVALGVQLLTLRSGKHSRLPATSPGALLLPDPRPWAVRREAKIRDCVEAVLRRPNGTVGSVTALHGAGGFGKTTLAALVSREPAVRDHFDGRILTVRMGPGVTGAAAIVSKVNDLIKLVGGENADYDDPSLAGAHLGQALGSLGRILLVIDDVWTEEQLTPFTLGAVQCARLVTSREARALPEYAVRIPVEQMTTGEARDVLTVGVGGLRPEIVSALLAATGRWPILLRLVNGFLTLAADDVNAAARQVLDRLRETGPAGVDDLSTGGAIIDPTNAEQRRNAIRATIRASTDLLPGQQLDRLQELAVFGSEYVVPAALAGELWNRTSGMAPLEARALVNAFADRSLLILDADSGGFFVHDVIHAYLSAELGAGRLRRLHEELLTALHVDPNSADLVGQELNAARENGYAAERMVFHLCESGRERHAAATVCDARWLSFRLVRNGVNAVLRDLAMVRAPEADPVRKAVTASSHLLGAADPEHGEVDVLLSRLQDVPAAATSVSALQRALGHPVLVNHWPLPDTSRGTLLRVLDHDGQVYGLAVTEDGSIVASLDGASLRVWEPLGRVRIVLDTARFSLRAVAISPDGAIIAAAGARRRLVLFDPATGDVTRMVRGPRRGLSQLRFTPDGRSVIGAGPGADVRVWSVATGAPERILRLEGPVTDMTISPDGAWLACVGKSAVTVWSLATWNEAATLPTGLWGTSLAALSPDALAVFSSGGGGVYVKTVPDGRHLLHLNLSGFITAGAAARDGTCILTGDQEGAVVVTDVASEVSHPLRTGHSDAITTLVAPAGSDFTISASVDRTARVSLLQADDSVQSPPRGRSMRAMDATRTGGFVIALDEDGRITCWTLSNDALVADFRPHGLHIRNLAVDPSGRRMATVHMNESVRVWDLWDGTSRPADAPSDRAGQVMHLGGVILDPCRPTFTGDGSRLAYVQNGRIVIRFADDGRPAQSVDPGGKRVACLAFAADSSSLAWGSADGMVTINDLSGRKADVRVQMPGKAAAIDFSRDGTRLAVALAEWSASYLLDVRSGDVVSVLDGHQGPVTSIMFSPQGDRVATTSADARLRIWDAPTGRLLCAMRVDGGLEVGRWIDDHIVVAAGGGGLYAFDLLG